jgi:hypothetical protein
MGMGSKARFAQVFTLLEVTKMRTQVVVRWGLAGVFSLTLAVLAGCSSNKTTGGLDSPHTLVRKAAVASVGETCDPKLYDNVVALLRDDPDRLVRSQAAFTLGDYSRRYYSVGYTPLVNALQNDPSVFVRAASALSLSATKDSRAVEPLIASLRDDDRGEMLVRNGDKATVYKACTADAARTSLEKIVGLQFDSKSAQADAKRMEVASQWEDWYTPRADYFPSQTAVAAQ